MNATTALLAAFSPLLVALIRKRAWDRDIVEILALLIIAILYIIGQWLDSRLYWPLTPEFWLGLVAAWGIQQASYKFLLRGSSYVEKLEDIGHD